MILDLLVLVLIGVGLGALGTLIGVGGGFVVVPLLLLAYNLDSQVAAGTSLLFVLFNTLSGTLAHHGQGKGNIDFKAGIPFSVAAIPGSIIGAFATSYLDPSLFRVVFAVVLIAISVYLLVNSRKALIAERKAAASPTPNSSSTDWRSHVNYRLGSVVCIGIGFVSSILGIGGGVILVPVMIIMLGFPIKIAAATSQFVLVITSAAGVLTHFGLGDVNLSIGLALGVGAIVGAPIGVILSGRTHGELIKIILAIALILTGIRLAILGMTGS